MAKYEHTVTAEEAGMTINTILRLNYRFSARFRTKIKYQHLIDLNGAPTPGYVKPEAGDIIGVRLPDEKSDFPPEDIPLDIIYEDDDIIILNKQPGIIVHPTHGHQEHTIANGVMKYMLDSGQSFKIRFANRIDMDTSGIVIVAKNANAQSSLFNQMKKSSVVKKYIALAEGDVNADSLSNIEGIRADNEYRFFIDVPIGRPGGESIRRCMLSTEDGGKEAVSEVEVIDYFEPGRPHTLLMITLHTGRTHQIRTHLSHIGHPIAGDSLYGGSTGLIDRQALHAYYIEFDHPHTGERISVKSPIPYDVRNSLGMY